MSLINHHAQKANLGGYSYVHEKKGEDLTENLEIQIVGQIGEYVGLLWMYNSPTYYMMKRDEQNKDPWKGDGGTDSEHFNTDIKTSRMRGSRNPLDYNLIINSKEREPGRNYLLCLVENFDERSAVVHIMGWADFDLVEDNVIADFKFKSGWAIPVRKLYCLRDFKGTIVAQND